MTPIWVNITLSRKELLATEVKAAYHNRLTIKSGMSQAHNARWQKSDLDSEQTQAKSRVFLLLELLLGENASVDLANASSTGQGHRHVQLIADDFNRLGDTGLPASA